MKEISPLVFGPGTWMVIHIMAIIYDQDKKGKIYFVALIKKILYNLPCKLCRNHSTKYYEDNPIDNNTELFRWTWQFHNTVNKMLSKPLLTYDEAKHIYENSEIILQEENCSTCSVSDDENREVGVTITKEDGM